MSEIKGLVGLRFHPTDEELVDYYLRNKNLGNESVVELAINEIDICKFDPWDLPWLSKLPTADRVWFFFCPRISKFSNRKRASRTTRAGYWKATGIDRKIRAKRSGNGVIGIKKTLVFYTGSSKESQRTDWVMHEYHPTFLPPHQRTFILCKVKDKEGEKAGISSCNGSEPSYILASESNNLAAINTAYEVQQPVQVRPEFLREHDLSVSELAAQPSEQEGLSLAELECPNEITNDLPGGQEGLSLVDLECPNEITSELPCEQEGLFLAELECPNEIISQHNVQRPSDLLTEADQEFLSKLEYGERRFVDELSVGQEKFVLGRSMFEHFSNYIAQPSLVGVYEDYSSDSDAETVSAGSYEEVSSPDESVGSSKENEQIPLYDLHGTEDYGSADSVSRSNTGKSENASDADNDPTRIQLQGKAMPAEAPKTSKEVAEPDSTDEHSKPTILKQNMARETSKKKYTSNWTIKGSYLLIEMAEICRKPDQLFVSLLKVVAGLILFVVAIRGVMILQ